MLADTEPDKLVDAATVPVTLAVAVPLAVTLGDSEPDALTVAVTVPVTNVFKDRRQNKIFCLVATVCIKWRAAAYQCIVQPIFRQA
jgi:hypothetical protein